MEAFDLYKSQWNPKHNLYILDDADNIICFKAQHFMLATDFYTGHTLSGK